MTTAFIDPAEAPVMLPILRPGSSNRRSTTPQVNAPWAPPPCSARSRGSGSARGPAGRGAGVGSAIAYLPYEAPPAGRAYPPSAVRAMPSGVRGAGPAEAIRAGLTGRRRARDDYG